MESEFEMKSGEPNLLIWHDLESAIEKGGWVDIWLCNLLTEPIRLENVIHCVCVYLYNDIF